MLAVACFLTATALAEDPGVSSVPPERIVVADGLWLGGTHGAEVDKPWSVGLVWTDRVADRWRAGASLRYAGQATGGDSSLQYSGEAGGFVERRADSFRAWPVRPGGVVEFEPLRRAPTLHVGSEVSARGGAFLKSAGKMPVGSPESAFYEEPAPGLFGEVSIYGGYRRSSRGGLTYGLDAGLRVRGFYASNLRGSNPGPARFYAAASLGYGWTPGESPAKPPREERVPAWSTRKRVLVWGSLSAVVIPAAALTLRTCGPVFACSRAG